VSFGGQSMDSADLALPHPRAHERAFVLAPWLEVEPAATVPGRGSVRALLDATGESASVYPAEPLL